MSFSSAGGSALWSARPAIQDNGSLSAAFLAGSLGTPSQKLHSFDEFTSTLSKSPTFGSPGTTVLIEDIDDGKLEGRLLKLESIVQAQRAALEKSVLSKLDKVEQAISTSVERKFASEDSSTRDSEQFALLLQKLQQHQERQERLLESLESRLTSEVARAVEASLSRVLSHDLQSVLKQKTGEMEAAVGTMGRRLDEMSAKVSDDVANMRSWLQPEVGLLLNHADELREALREIGRTQGEEISEIHRLSTAQQQQQNNQERVRAALESSLDKIMQEVREIAPTTISALRSAPPVAAPIKQEMSEIAMMSSSRPSSAATSGRVLSNPGGLGQMTGTQSMGTSLSQYQASMDNFLTEDYPMGGVSSEQQLAMAQAAPKRPPSASRERRRVPTDWSQLPNLGGGSEEPSRAFMREEAPMVQESYVSTLATQGPAAIISELRGTWSPPSSTGVPKRPITAGRRPQTAQQEAYVTDWSPSHGEEGQSHRLLAPRTYLDRMRRG